MRRHVAFALLTLAALPGCSRDERTTSHSYHAIIRSDQPTSTITIDGVRLVIDNQMRIETSLGEAVEGVAGDPVGALGVLSPGAITDLASPSFTIAGAPLDLRDGHLFLGETDYGPVEPGVEVTIDPDGVAVGGERRGALP